ncbi:MAG: MgtC/SapB family protein [Niabella sp.]|nr:MAG: MgtC/SapB family protein [Niabella sp.]
MISQGEILIRLSIACLFGALIGLERERKNWTAGLRTHMMVCVGACLIMIVSAFGFSDILQTDHVTLDPSRIAAQVISGIGFIGAGTILFFRQGTVHGLTTAAGLWTVAAIGLATGGGMYFAAGATAIIAIIILWALHPLEKMFAKKFKQRILKIVTSQHVNNTDLLKNLINNFNLKIESFNIIKGAEEFVFELSLETNGNNLNPDEIIDVIKTDPNIKLVYWEQ